MFFDSSFRRGRVPAGLPSALICSFLGLLAMKRANKGNILP